jgi:ribosomal protein S18 acetylase RimI-like enzyme
LCLFSPIAVGDISNAKSDSACATPHWLAKKERQMTPEILRDHIAKLSVETVDQLTERDIHELSDAAEAAILAGGGFGWLLPPPKSVMEDYWRGVQMIPDRHLILARLDKVIAGSCQILRPPKNNEAQKFSCQLTTFFVAPWARGHGLAQMIVAEAEALAKSEGFLMINLDVRATQDRAIQSFQARNFKRYATNDHYAKVDGAYVPGYYYHKEL